MFMAVGLSIRVLILITSVWFSLVEDGNKRHDDLLNPVVFHHHGEPYGVVLKFFNVFSGYALHGSSSTGSAKKSAF